jgi:DNA helicase HerA-like ATPase
MGPLLLARMLALNETQAGVLNLVFKIADDNGMLLLDLKDLRAMCITSATMPDFTTEYGNISSASIGAIQRGLLGIDQQGGDRFFGEPALNIADLMQTDDEGRGVVNILAADRLLAAPKAYATLLLWLLAELFEELPEIGDPEKPKLMFFRRGAPAVHRRTAGAVGKIEQAARAIGSEVGRRVIRGVLADIRRRRRPALIPGADAATPSPAFARRHGLRLACGDGLLRESGHRQAGLLLCGRCCHTAGAAHAFLGAFFRAHGTVVRPRHGRSISDP